MISIRGKYWQQLVLFVASLLCTILFSFGTPNGQQAVTAATTSNSVDTALAQFERLESLQSASYKEPPFDEIRAAYVEPNFYN